MGGGPQDRRGVGCRPCRADPRLPHGAGRCRGDHCTGALPARADCDGSDGDRCEAGVPGKRGCAGGEGDFEERELEITTVDLTELVDKEVSVLTTELDIGEYTKIELFVDEIVGMIPTPADYEYVNEEEPSEEIQANVKVPSGKLMINIPFEIEAEETTEFLFDINVVKKGKDGIEYNLKPVIAKSGVKDKIKGDDDEPECSVDDDCADDEFCDDGECEDNDDYVNEE